MEEEQELQLHINGEPWLDSKEATTDISDKLPKIYEQHKCYTFIRWLRVSIYTIFLLAGQTIATLLGRLYYDKGGNSKWLSALVQLIGFPLLLPCYFYINNNKPIKIHTRTETTSLQTVRFSSPLILVSVYVTLGLLLAGECLLYSLGLLYLPVSTYSLISASQLAFNALFSFCLNSQKFTPSIINSLVLLTVSSTLLVLQHEPETSESSKESKYTIGFICTIGGSAGYSLMLSLTQLAFEKILKKETFKTVLDMITYQSLVATCAVLVGLFGSGDWKILKKEMHEFKLGKVSYLTILLGATISWQVFSIGAVGLIIEVSSLFSNIISTLGLPAVPVLAVIFFHDEMSGIKVIAMVLAIWGFVSYAYQHYLGDQKPETKDQTDARASSPPVEHERN